MYTAILSTSDRTVDFRPLQRPTNAHISASPGHPSGRPDDRRAMHNPTVHVVPGVCTASYQRMTARSIFDRCGDRRGGGALPRPPLPRFSCPRIVLAPPSAQATKPNTHNRGGGSARKSWRTHLRPPPVAPAQYRTQRARASERANERRACCAVVRCAQHSALYSSHILFGDGLRLPARCSLLKLQVLSVAEE